MCIKIRKGCVYSILTEEIFVGGIFFVRGVLLLSALLYEACVDSAYIVICIVPAILFEGWHLVWRNVTWRRVQIIIVMVWSPRAAGGCRTNNITKSCTCASGKTEEELHMCMRVFTFVHLCLVALAE